MKNNKSEFFENITTLLFFFLIGIIPLVTFGLTTENYDFPKLVILSSGVVILLGLLLFSWMLKGKIILTKTPLDKALLALLLIVILSTIFSSSIFTSIIGNFPRVHGSAVSWTVYILLYFISASILNSQSKIKNLLYILYASGVVVGLISLLSFLGIYLPFDYAKSVNFSLAGLPFSTSAFLILLMPLPLLSVISRINELPESLGLFLTILFGLVIALTGSVSEIVLLLFVFAFCITLAKARQMKISPFFMIPLGIIIFSLIIAYVPFPGNKLHQIESVFPREIQLPLSISWKISAGALRDSPLIGTGPSTYLFNFSAYKPLEFNQLKYWNFTFDTAHNEILQILGTLGILGLAAFGYMYFVVFNVVRKSLNHHSNLLLSLAMSSLMALILFLIHATSLVSIAVTIVFFACLMVIQEADPRKYLIFAFGSKADKSASDNFDLLPLIIFVIYLIAAIPSFYFIYVTALSDIYHRRALSYINTNGKLTYEYLQKAESLNKYIDLYRVDLAQINFALANALASQKGTSTASPSGSLTDADKKNIQTLLSQAISEARVSVTLNPLSSRNWSVLGQIYRNITGVAQNALTFSLDAYGRAIQRDPFNPILRLNVGGIYYASKNYDSAVRFFSDAVNLKPDYANAYYNLAIALKDKGDIPNAVLIAQQTVNLLQKDVNFKTNPDYVKAYNLLNELKSRSSGKNISSPAAQTDSALSNPKLPDISVTDLNNPPLISTPSAIRSNPDARLPQSTPVPNLNP